MAKVRGLTSMVNPKDINKKVNIGAPSDMELDIGLKVRDLWESSVISELLSYNTVKVTYWAVDRKLSTYGETTKEVKFNKEATFFNRIDGVIIHSNEERDLEDGGGDEERGLQVRLAPKTSYIISQSRIKPMENDHIIFEYHEKTGVRAYPYRINRVNPVVFDHREAFVIEYAPSEIFGSREELNERTLRTYKFIDSDISDGNNKIVSYANLEYVDTFTEIYSYLSNSYTESFYSDLYDVASVNGVFNNISDSQDTRPNMSYLIYYALKKFQENERVLRYRGNGTLFLGSAYNEPREETNYKKSLYGKLINKSFCERDKDDIHSNSISNDHMILFNNFMKKRDLYNDELPYIYNAKYDYSTKLHFRYKSEHSILSRFYKQKIVTVNMIEVPEVDDGLTRSGYIWYTITNPLFCKILDLYLDDKIEDISSKKLVNELKNYTIEKDNVDDYIALPMILYILRDVVNYYAVRKKDEDTYW